VSQDQVLQGITLKVYLFVAKKNKPIGPREVTKGVSLSSPSVAYRHLQKLEDAGYLSKNEFGEYCVSKRAALKGQIWLSRTLIPKMWIYVIVFLGILIIELTIFAIHYPVENYQFRVLFSLLTLITSLALGVFLIEGILQRPSKIDPSNSE
jgi:hypothetical protein